MKKDEMEAALVRVMDKFVARDRHLLAANASERSMSHQIAVYFAAEFPDFNVDCEYNRDGFDVKRLQLSQRPVSDDDEEAVTVFPDIVVHRRGTNDHNLLVIEMKKAMATSGLDYDRSKLRAFRDELRYAWAAQLVIGEDAHGNVIRQWEWVE